MHDQWTDKAAVEALDQAHITALATLGAKTVELNALLGVLIRILEADSDPPRPMLVTGSRSYGRAIRPRVR